MYLVLLTMEISETIPWVQWRLKWSIRSAVFTAVFEGFMTLRANNFSSGGTLVMFLVFIWRMKCFLSILVIEYPISPFLVSWGRFLSTSKSTPTQDYISKKSPPNLSSLLADCRAEVWTNHSHEAKNNYTGYFFDWHWQKTFQSSNSFRIQHQKLANLRIILIQSQNIPQNSCKNSCGVHIISSTTVNNPLLFLGGQLAKQIVSYE